MPIDLLIYRRDEFKIGEQRRIEERDPYFRKLSLGWSEALREAFTHIDEYGKDAPEAADGKVASMQDRAGTEVAAQATAGWISDVDR
jgi:predicted proteasome-type protease